MHVLARLTGWFVLVVAASSPVPSLAGDAADADRSAIAGLLRKTWEKPQTPLTAEPIVVSGEHAIADWRQGDDAGRALLRRGASSWNVVLCAGDALTERSFLVEAGVPDNLATALADALAKAEQNLPQELKERMTRFKNVVRMHP